MRNQKFRC